MEIIHRIKSFFRKFLNKQLPQAEVRKNMNKSDKIFYYKTKLLAEMSNDEINKIILDIKLHPLTLQSYDDKQILEEILKRIGADEELIKRSVTNDRINTIYRYHRLGKLIATKDGRTVYKDNTNRTTIEYKDGVIELNNSNYYDYYTGCVDARPTNQVKISINDLGGITLENNEIDPTDGKQLTSKIVFDSNNIEMKKEKGLFELDNGEIAVSMIERSTNNPFIIKETWKMDNTSIVRYDSINPKYPDQLYSHYFINKDGVYGIRNIEEIPTIEMADINMKELKTINPKAAKYFESLDLRKQVSVENNK